MERASELRCASRRGRWGFAGTFVVILWMPIVLAFLGWGLGSDGDAEKRQLAEFPIFEWDGTDAFFSGLNAYVDDRFPLRSKVIGAFGYLRHYVFGAASDQVMVGRDHWLFFRGNEVIEDLTGQNPMTEKELDHWFGYFEERQRRLAEKGIDYLLVIVPGKAEMHGEYLPRRVSMNRKSTRLDQIMERFESGSNLNLLNLESDLARLREKEGELYWPYDTHWNGKARLEATRILAEKAKGFVPSLDTGLITDSLETYEDYRLADLIDMLGLRDMWPRYELNMMRWETPVTLRQANSPVEEMEVWKTLPAEMAPVVTENPDGNGRLLFVSDSFFRAGGVPLEKMREMPVSFAWERFVGLWTWIRPVDLDWIVEVEKPDLVIEQRVERYLHIFP